MEVATLPARVRGLTLVELLTTLTVTLVLLGIGIPGWAYVTQGSAVTAARNQMRTVLGMARLAAVKNDSFVTVCPSSDMASCNNDHTSWHDGYLLFLDVAGNRQVDSGDTLLRTFDVGAPGLTIHSSSGRRALRFARDGSAWGSNVTLRFCSDSHPARNKAIMLYGTGRARLSDTLGNGSQVSC